MCGGGRSAYCVDAGCALGTGFTTAGSEGGGRADLAEEDGEGAGYENDKEEGEGGAVDEAIGGAPGRIPVSVAGFFGEVGVEVALVRLAPIGIGHGGRVEGAG